MGGAGAGVWALRFAEEVEPDLKKGTLCWM